MIDKQIILFSLICFIITSTTARDITTNNGKVYKNVDVKAKVNGLTIFHDYGASFENFDNLPKTIQREFHYDKTKADIYEAKLKLKRQQQVAKLAKYQALKKRNQHQADQAKKMIDQQQQTLLAKLKPLIKEKGIPAVLVSQVLYNLDGNPVFASTSLKNQSKIFLVYNKYMLVDEQLYLIKDNTIPVSKKISKLKEQVDKFTKLLTTQQTKIEAWQKLIDSNKEKITKAEQIIREHQDLRTTITTTKRFQKKTYQTKKDVYSDLLKKQRALVIKYMKENKNLKKTTKTLPKKNKSDTKKLKKYNIDYSVLTEALNKFNTEYNRLQPDKP